MTCLRLSLTSGYSSRLMVKPSLEGISQHHSLDFSSCSVHQDNGLLMISKSMFSMQVMLVLMRDILNHFLVKEEIISSVYYYVSIESFTNR